MQAEEQLSFNLGQQQQQRQLTRLSKKPTLPFEAQLRQGISQVEEVGRDCTADVPQLKEEHNRQTKPNTYFPHQTDYLTQGFHKDFEL
jgi:hypothetical protein